MRKSIFLCIIVSFCLVVVMPTLIYLEFVASPTTKALLTAPDNRTEGDKQLVQKHRAEQLLFDEIIELVAGKAVDDVYTMTHRSLPVDKKFTYIQDGNTQFESPYQHYVFFQIISRHGVTGIIVDVDKGLYTTVALSQLSTVVYRPEYSPSFAPNGVRLNIAKILAPDTYLIPKG